MHKINLNLIPKLHSVSNINISSFSNSNSSGAFETHDDININLDFAIHILAWILETRDYLRAPSRAFCNNNTSGFCVCLFRVQGFLVGMSYMFMHLLCRAFLVDVYLNIAGVYFILVSLENDFSHINP